MAAVAPAAAQALLPSVFIQGGAPPTREELARDLTAFRVIENRRDASLVLVIDSPDDDRSACARAIKRCRVENPRAVLVLLSSGSRMDTFIEAFRDGASDCLRWPAERGRLQVWCERVMRQSRPAGALLGSSPVMNEVRVSLQQVAAVNCRVLLCGETGTGKEVAARSVHAWSVRAAQPFVTINCPAIPETLFESELFGFERGAFSGAVQAHAGRLMDGERGTVFLDEVSELPLPVQAKLLRVMEQGEIQRLGSRGTQRVDVRWIAATNRDLRAMTQAGAFRSDLYYRLAVAEMYLPPLRQRKEDVPELAEHFAAVAAGELMVTPRGFTAGALQALEAHDWPGNLRELRNAIEIALIRAGASPISEAHLPPAVVGQRERDPADDLERIRILDALQQVQWNKSEAAKRLHWSRMTLYRKLAYHHLDTAGAKRLKGD
jgi:DNA-binding NtrC family response regulator